MPAGFSSDRLARIDKFMQEAYIDSGRFPGTVTHVSRGGEVAYCKVLGEMDSELGKPMREDTIFRFYSMSKPITSVALMMLYEQGLFQLNDPVSRFIPAWKDMRVYVSGGGDSFVTKLVEREITFRDLLSHQSGFTYGSDVRTPVEAAYTANLMSTRNDETLADWAKKLVDIPLLFSPGTRWNYSISTDICGYLVELISGQRFDKYLEEKIFQPLGMVDTAFSVPDSKLDRFAACYAPTKDGKRTLQDDPKTSQFAKEQSFYSGGGGLVSTISDYFAFTEMLRKGGEHNGAKLLGRKTIELMTKNHLTGGKALTEAAVGSGQSETNFAGVGFGLGFSVVLDNPTAQIAGSPGQYGWGGAASTAFWIDPVEDVTVIFLTQLMPSSTYPVRRELQVMVNAALD